MQKDQRIFAKREKSLEEAFFARQTEELKRKLRERQEQEEMREELRRIAVVTDDDQSSIPQSGINGDGNCGLPGV